MSIIDVGAILRCLYRVSKHMSQQQLRLSPQNNVTDSQHKNTAKRNPPPPPGLYPILKCVARVAL